MPSRKAQRRNKPAAAARAERERERQAEAVRLEWLASFEDEPEAGQWSGSEEEPATEPVRAPRRRGAQRPEAGGYQGASVDPLERIRSAAAARARAEQAIAAAVEDARRAGISWHRIGGVLEVTGEGARQRYGVRKPPPAAL